MTELPALEHVMRCARLGEPLSDVDFFQLARALDEVGKRGAPRLDALRALLAPGRRNGAFYLAAAFDDALAAPRSAYARAEKALAARREEMVRQLRERCGVDAPGDEVIVLRARYDGPLPEGLTIVRDTPEYRAAVIRLDTTARDAAYAALARAEHEARRALADAIAECAGAPTGANDL